MKAYFTRDVLESIILTHIKECSDGELATIVTKLFGTKAYPVLNNSIVVYGVEKNKLLKNNTNCEG